MVRALSSLRSLGLVATTDQTIRILDVSALRQYVEAPRNPAGRPQAQDGRKAITSSAENRFAGTGRHTL